MPLRSPTAAVHLVPDSVKSPADLLCCRVQTRQQRFPGILRGRSTWLLCNPSSLHCTALAAVIDRAIKALPSLLRTAFRCHPDPPCVQPGAFRKGRVSPLDEGRAGLVDDPARYGWTVRHRQRASWMRSKGSSPGVAPPHPFDGLSDKLGPAGLGFGRIVGRGCPPSRRPFCAKSLSYRHGRPSFQVFPRASHVTV